MTEAQKEVFPTTFSTLFPDHIDWLYESRESRPHPLVLNMNISMFSAMLLEGTLEYVFRSAIRQARGLKAFAVLPSQTLADRALIEFDNSIRNVSGWDKYKKTFKSIFGENIGSMVDGEIVEAIAILFQLRGAVVAHGRAANFLGDPRGIGPFEWESGSGGLQNISVYLKKHKFPSHEDGDLLEPGWFFSNEITDHFYENVIRLIVEIGLLDEVQNKLLWNAPAGKTAELVKLALDGRAMPEGA